MREFACCSPLGYLAAAARKSYRPPACVWCLVKPRYRVYNRPQSLSSRAYRRQCNLSNPSHSRRRRHQLRHRSSCNRSPRRSLRPSSPPRRRSGFRF